MSPACLWLSVQPYWSDMLCTTCPAFALGEGLLKHVLLPLSNLIRWQGLRNCPSLLGSATASWAYPHRHVSTHWPPALDTSSGARCLHRKKMPLCSQFLAWWLTQRRCLINVGWMKEWMHKSVFQNLFLKFSRKVESGLPVGSLKACWLVKS